MRVPLNPRLVALAGAGAAATVAVHVARKVRKGSGGEPRTCSQTRVASTPKAAAVVHAFQASSPLLSESGSPSAETSSHSRAVFSSGLVLLLATLLITSAAGVAALRQQWDLVGAVVVAWALVLLSQVLHQRLGSTGTSSTSTSSIVEFVEADAQVQLVDAEPAKMPDMSGTWIKDSAASDSMEPAMTLIRLNGITRTAVRLIKGTKLALDERYFAFGVFSVISCFKVTERYVLGEPCQQRRRDLRRGRSSNLARLTPWGSVVIEYEWGAPHAGRGVDEFKLDDEGRLILDCKLTVGGETAGYRHVYHRKH